MATIDKAHTTLDIVAFNKPLKMNVPFFGMVGTVTIPAILPTVTPEPGPPVGFVFDSPTIDANASMRLTGTAGESVAGWTLGFIQLKYIGTNHSHYRGATPRQGSIKVTSSNQILCRDTDIPSAGKSPEVWYDSLNFPGGTRGPQGTNQLAAGTVIPPSGFLDVPAHLFDQPHRGVLSTPGVPGVPGWASVETNTVAPGSPGNYLRHTVIELLFCTMLVAQEPGGQFHMLKHFYWNVIWEHTFKVDASSTVVLDKAVRLQHNIQRPAHTGNPNDRKFKGKEFDVTLPVSNTVSRRPPHRLVAADWRHG